MRSRAWQLLWAKCLRGDGPSGVSVPPSGGPEYIPGAGRFHPLVFHMLDVVAVVRAMWVLALPPRLRGRMAKALRVSEEAARDWLSFWAGLHDMGKATPAFQGRWPDGKARLQALGLEFPPLARPVSHGTTGAAVLADEVLERVGLGREAAVRIATAVAGHHGEFPRLAEWIDLSSLDLGSRKWTQVRSEVSARLAETVGCASSAPEPDVADEAFFTLLAGLTSVADWLASAEEHFPYEEHVDDVAEYWARAQWRAKACLDALGWARLEARGLPEFREILGGHEPNELQRAVDAIAARLPGPSLVVVEAPMGLGKTEAAYWLAEQWGADGLGGFYFALPTEATSNQMFERTRRFLTRRFPEERVNLHLVHGHAALSGLYRQMRLSAVEDDKKGGNVVAEEWFTPKKRAFLAPFGVGTVDQALLSVLRVRHGFVRLFGLAQKTVVVDEVHAYDTYMSTLLEWLLAWLRSMGASAVLLSATLPKERRVALMRGFAGAAIDVPEAPYPRISWVSGNRAGCSPFECAARKEFSVEWLRPDPDEVASRLSDALRFGGCAAWICNTVEHAQETYRVLKRRGWDPDKDLMLFHARYPYDEREKRERRALEAFGKEGKRRPDRAVLVATQVVEQSLDVDFDLLITEIAPVDLVLQRVGRVHRHERQSRPQGVGIPAVWLLEPEIRDGVPQFGGSSRIYEEYVLLRSWLALKDKRRLTLPADIDALIEQVYGDRELPAAADAIIRRLQETKAELDAKREEQERQARDRLIRTPLNEVGFLGMFDADLEEDDPSVHVGLQALTRLGEPSVEVVCLHDAPAGCALDRCASETVSLDEEPSLEMVGKLLRRSVRLSHRGVVPHLLRQPVPPGWGRSPFLRHHRCLIFRDGRCEVGGWLIELHDEMGLLIERRGDVRA